MDQSINCGLSKPIEYRRILLKHVSSGKPLEESGCNDNYSPHCNSCVVQMFSTYFIFSMIVNFLLQNSIYMDADFDRLWTPLIIRVSWKTDEKCTSRYFAGTLRYEE